MDLTRKTFKKGSRMPQFWGPFLLQNWSKNGKILDPLFGSVLGSSGLRFGAQNGPRKSKKRDPKMEHVFERSGRLLGTVLEAFLAVLGFSWEA
jgi:muramoyltetrapeptide carboxypeptidase LdcA involved in peptidoglycan recycling